MRLVCWRKEVTRDLVSSNVHTHMFHSINDTAQGGFLFGSLNDYNMCRFLFGAKTFELIIQLG